MKTFNEIPLSVLDLAPIVEGGSAADSFRNTLEFARHAERLGYNRVWLAEHHNMPGVASSATSVLIGYVAAGTERIRVGSGGVMLPNHAPIVIAEQFGTLETIYPDRIDLGLGRAPGSDRPAAHALRRTLYSDGDDFPDLLEELRFFFREPAEGQKVQAVPGGGTNIPIWLLGSSGFSARLAGQLGLPFSFAAHFSPEYTLPALKLYRESFVPSDDLKEPYAMVALNVFAAETDDEARRIASSQHQAFLAMIRNRPGRIKPPVEDMDAVWTPDEKALVASRLGGSVIGSAETVRSGLEEFVKNTQADELMISGMFFDQTDRLRSYEIVAELHGGAKMHSVGG